MYIPFTYPFIIRTNLKYEKTLLDVGSGNGRFMTEINWDKKFKVIGVELFDVYIKQAKATKLYEKILKKDIMELAFEKNSFDAVLASQIVEHFTKQEGILLIKKMERWAGNTVIIGTPNGHFHQEEWEGNKLQAHKSSWQGEDYKKLGYKVYGQGFKLVYGRNGFLSSSLANIRILSLVMFFFSYLLSPFVYFFPRHAAYLIAIKKLRNEKQYRMI